MISIVVITYNRIKSLKHCIRSLLNQSYKDYEIIIIDDGSARDTQHLVKALQRKHRIIKYFRQKNKGRGAARNLGLRKAKGSIVAFTDDDCIVSQNWLEGFNTLFENHPNIAAVGGSIVNNDKNQFGEAAYILNFSSWMPTGEKKYLKDIPTANIAYKKKDISKMRFPVNYQNLDYEDSVFNSNLVVCGKKILFDPSIKIVHNPKISCYDDFLKNQQRKALSFLFRGYKTHNLTGRLLIKFKFINLFCPRLLLILFRCSKSLKYFSKFILYSPLIFRGELERGLTIIKQDKFR